MDNQVLQIPISAANMTSTARQDTPDQLKAKENLHKGRSMSTAIGLL
jgi:hypothetical protein